jgi:hypothetical protein
MRQGSVAHIAILLALGTAAAKGQGTPQPAAERPLPLIESGNIVRDGHAVPYTIQRLPPSSFPDLPAPIADRLNRRGCLIPQTYEAHRPENVIHASLERAGSSDWALLCATKGMVSLLVFFASTPDRPFVLATSRETECLQLRKPGEVLGFDWGIDSASPEQVREAQSGMGRRPAPLDHDALADSVVERRTIFHFYTKGTWTLVDLPE